VCITPTNLPEIGPVACRYCWQCIENRKNDYVGRCMAEQETSDGVLAVALTYGGGDVNPHAAILVYKDFQDFMKRLRRAGYKVRYIVAGEYGSKKGRCHWHAVLFFEGKTPKVEINKDRYTWKYWPHGFSYFQQPDADGFAYLMKYAIKDTGQNVAVTHLGRSLKPPLGDKFFYELAGRYVAQNLAPQDYFYSFDNVFDKNRKRRVYMMQGVTRANFIEYYLQQYEEQRGGTHPISDIITEHLDRTCGFANERTEEQWQHHLTHDATGSKRPLPYVYRDEREDEETRYYHGMLSGVPVGIESTNRQGIVVHYGDNEQWHVNEPETKRRIGKQTTSVQRVSKQKFMLDRTSG